MKYLSLIICVFLSYNSFCQETIEAKSFFEILSIDVSSYENFSIQNGQQDIPLMKGGVFTYDQFGKVDSKTGNYQPVMITAYPMDNSTGIPFYDYLKEDFRNKSSKIGCLELKKDLPKDVIVLQISGEVELPFKYLVYSVKLFDDLIIDFLKMDIKNDAELEAYLTTLSKYEYILE